MFKIGDKVETNEKWNNYREKVSGTVTNLITHSYQKRTENRWEEITEIITIKINNKIMMSPNWFINKGEN